MSGKNGLYDPPPPLSYETAAPLHQLITVTGICCINCAVLVEDLDTAIYIYIDDTVMQVSDLVDFVPRKLDLSLRD